jgi:pyridoxamine 5'-phosphate oxidase
LDTPPVLGRSRGSPPGPWELPSDHPDLSKAAGFRPAPAGQSIKHAEFALSLDSDPIQLFVTWFKAARTAGEAAPEAMVLSTVDGQGMPDSRMMLLHWINDGRFQFSSYSTSTKGKELSANPKAALLFYWKATGQQVRVRGTVTPFSGPQNEELRPFKRPTTDLRLHDWALHQSEVFHSAEELETQLSQARARFQGDVPIRDWTGYFLVPESIEFFRPVAADVNAERVRYFRRSRSASWAAERLVP